MANELEIVSGNTTVLPSGSLVAATLRRESDLFFFNTVTGLFELPASPAWPSYAVGLSELPSGSSHWYGNVPLKALNLALEVTYWKLLGGTFVGPGTDTIVGSEDVVTAVAAKVPPPPGLAVGYYTNQPSVENIFGVLNVAKWSQKDNTSAAVADTAQVQGSLDRCDHEFDRAISYYGYAVPIVTTATDFPFISDLAAEYTGVLLYEARGLHDTADKKASAWAGKMEGHRERVMGNPEYAAANVARNLGELRRLCINGLRGVSKGVTGAPFVQTVYPSGSMPPAGKANWPATAPDVLS